MAELETMHPSQAAGGFSLLRGFGVKFPNFSQNPHTKTQEWGKLASDELVLLLQYHLLVVRVVLP